VFYQGATYGKSPLLSMAGLTRGYRTTTWHQFPMSNAISGNAAAQNVVTEDASIAAITATSYAAAQDTNYLEIHNVTTTYSYAAQALPGGVSGVAINGDPLANIRSPQVQREAKMRQLAGDLEFSALRGTGQAWTNAATSGATGGLVTAVEAGSETAAAGAALSTTLIDTEIARMAAAGAEFVDMVIACGAYQMQQLNKLYGNPPMDRMVAGVALQTIFLPIAGRCGLVYDPVLATDDVVFVDMAHFSPVFGIVPGKPPIFFEPRAKVGSGDYEALYCLFGIDYHDIIYHGMVSGLATS
jgi:hypothetical protein